MPRRADSPPAASNVIPIPIRRRLRPQGYARIRGKTATLSIPLPATAEMQLLVLDRLAQNVVLLGVDIRQHGAVSVAQFRHFVRDLGPTLVAEVPVSEVEASCGRCGQRPGARKGA